MIAARSPIVRLGIETAGPLALVAAAFLFFAGHNRPGGGFSAGLLFGAVIALRTVAGMRAPANAVPFIASGVAIVCLVALSPFVWGEVLLDQVVLKTTVPLLDTIKGGSALVFDAGVSLIVVGLVIAVLDGLGATAMAVEPKRSKGARR